jgi:uncharacterized protein (TIGR04222 family)
MGLGPFDLTGGPFLQLYGVLLVVTIILGLLIPRWLRPDGRSAGTSDPDELAWLAGGKTRFADAVVARLLAARALFIVGKDAFQPDPHHQGRTPAERSVLALSSPAKWNTVQGAIHPHADPVRRRLIANDLLMDGGTVLQMRFWQTTPYLLLLLFGAIKLEVGMSRDRPVGYLTLLLILTAILALVRFLAVDRRTRGGKAVLAQARSNADRIRRAPTAEETGLAVALCGTTVLAGSAWAEYHRMRSAGDASSSSGDSGSSSDGGGSSGCGGGGCGGCGS